MQPYQFPLLLKNTVIIKQYVILIVKIYMLLSIIYLPLKQTVKLDKPIDINQSLVN